MSRLKIALAQMDFAVGAIGPNLKQSLRCIEQARAVQADLLLLPELALTGYPPEDLLHRSGFLRSCDNAFSQLAAACHDIDVVVCHPWQEQGHLYNAASWVRDGRVIDRYFKHCLPNYAVFDERRYFHAGSAPLVVEVKGVRAGLLICEDAWEASPAEMARDAGAEILLVPNASPYRQDKLAARKKMLSRLHDDCGLPVVYLNCVGGQDELVFDGRSMLLSRSGSVTAIAPLCEDLLLTCNYEAATGDLSGADWPEYTPRQLADTWQSLVRGTRDYVRKNGFTDVVLGSSGGIDSALTLALAVDAVGKEHVHAVMMPSRFTSDLSLDLADEAAELLAVDHRTISIEPAFAALQQSLDPSFADVPPDVTEENLQARCRANILMALANKFNWLLLTTGNKSELSVGYCTIYGDMAGGFSPVKDCYKTLVYELAEYRNSVSAAIPQGIIDRPPSAELAPGQTDQDSLPPYALLDDILYRYIDLDRSISDIVADGFDESLVRRIAGLVLLSDWKRRQGAPGVRISSKGFGRDRRYPITSGWLENSAGNSP
jgi:NAD+ synthase (glutamine-hydrolysing)